MTLKQEILKWLQDSQEKSFEVNQIAQGLGKDSAEDFPDIVKAVADLERNGDLILNKEGRVQLPASQGQLVGKFRSNAKGFGFIEHDEDEADVFIPKHRTNSAMEGDIVAFSIEKKANPKQDKGAEGTVTDIIERAQTSIIGEFLAYDKPEDNEYLGYLEPRDKKLPDMIVYIKEGGLQPVAGQIIQVEITDYPSKEQPNAMFGLASEIIGHKNDPGIDILTIAYQHGIPTEFSEETLKEAEDIPNEVLPEEAAGRRDLRDLMTVTIDGPDAKDIDDAISIAYQEDGHYRLWVHIADVSHYVTEGSSLDEDAFDRGTSVYLTDRVIPMLPPKLSNGICSLNPNVDRLAMTCEMVINHNGKVTEYEIYPSLIQSNHRMTYDEVNAIIEEDDSSMKAKYADVAQDILTMADLHKILERMRYQRGAINFDSKEAEIELDAKGKPVAIHLRERRTGERLIESFMLAANETVSFDLNQRDLPALYRVHERPDPEKLQSFIEFSSAFGIEIKGTKDTVSPRQLQTILDEVKGKAEEAVISMTLLRSMQQARYDVKALGHFGLAAEYYSHFTAPIRRYPDLILHRLLHYYWEVGTSKKEQNKWKKDLPEIAEQSSVTERRAVDAERQVDEMKKVEYMVDKVGQVFDAVIVSVTNFGIFVQLENTVEGLIHISDLKEDYFNYNEQGHILVGERTGKIYRIGEPLKVKLVNADVDQANLDFEIEYPEEAQPKNNKNQADSKSKSGQKGKQNRKSQQGRKQRGKSQPPKSGQKKNGQQKRRRRSKRKK